MQTASHKVYTKSQNQQEHLKDIDNCFHNLGKQCVQQMFETQALQTPDAVAVVFAEKSLTYQELNQQANQLAHYLKTLGVKPEVMVGIYVERSLEMIVAILGVLKAGGAYVPIDPNYPPERVNFILEDTQTPFLLTQENLLPHLENTTAQLFCLDSQWTELAQQSQDNPDCETNIENLMYVIYTSGSTGKPKGVMVPHRGIVNQLYWRQTTFGLSNTDKVLQNIPFSFDPSVWQIFWTLCYGGQLVLPHGQGHKDTAYLVKLIAEQQITITAFVPSMLRVLLEEEGIKACQCLRHISCGGEALTMDLVKLFCDRTNLQGVLCNVYGPTEASIDATFWQCLSADDLAVAPIGKAITNADIYILDENLQPTPIGEPGEIHIGGIGLARGYLNRPELSYEKFIPHPLNPEPTARLYKTGDLGRFLADGNIEFLGRIDHQVKIRGFRIELGEIEATLLQLPHIREAVVIARQDTSVEKRLVAYLVPQVGQTIKVREIRRYLQQKLADYMVPAIFVVLESLPLNPNGKIDRQALPIPNPTRPELEPEFMAARSQLEAQLAEIWQELLGIEAIGIHDNFFELGGSSLLAVRMLAQIEHRCKQKLPLTTFLQATTIAELADILQKEDHSELWSTLVPIQPNGKKPPLFFIHGADGNVLVFQHLVKYLDSEQPIYGLQAHILDGKKDIRQRIEDIATEYIQYIRNVQPQGPYNLCGYSVGGVIIFEMAQQLLAQGEDVGLLALLDTTCPKYYRQLSLGNWLAYHWQTFKNLKLAHKLIYLQGGLQERWRKTVIAIQEIVSPSIPTVNKTSDEEEIFSRFVNAVCDYIPQMYPGKIILFRCLEQIWWVQHDRQLGWAELTEKPVEVIDVPGHHDHLISINHEFIGVQLSNYLTSNT
ncbi:amino acid adenylation domain-containing protein [Calothrix sp. UHCC 0171]|uniref:non-ribosomal peptide synthetase n=1 Tax=Calothrix sp. UHCC 0171 TaxID=3110245 RepID=UPI002B1ECA86|nr:amino acid adenylation domain-containing protein [Calothrix sp. UHCC 0171]MEA5570288.1 amino acid adenylation domain-containing protein [Calothrix sp. UHCC 0171]